MGWTLTDTTTAVDLTAETDAPSLSVAQRAYAETSRLSARIIDEAGTLTIATEHEINLSDGGVTHFAGYVRVCRRLDRGVSSQRVYEIEAQDYTTALGDDVADSDVGLRANGESDKARIAAIGAAFGTRGIVYSGATIIQLRAVMPDQDFRGLTLHQCLSEICKITGGTFYVGFDKVLHYFNVEVNAAPFGLSDAPNGTTTFGYEDFSLPDDSAQFVNAVYVIGTGIADWRPSAAAVAALRAAGTLRATVVNNSEVIDATTLALVGDAVLAQYGAIRQPSSLVTYKPGLRAGMTVQVTHSGWSIAAVTYRIASIEARPVDANRIAYTIFFGSNPISLGDLMRQQSMSIAEAVLQSAVTDGKVESVLDLSTGGANLVPNSSFEDGSSWVVGGSWTIGFAAADAYQGAKEARYTPAAVDTALSSPFITVDRLDSYWASAWIFCRAFTSGRLRLLVEEYNAASTLLATTVVGEVAAVGTGWRRVSKKFGPATTLGLVTWQATTTKVKVVVSPNGVNATGTWSVDGVQLERGNLLTAYSPSPYELVDGSITGTKIAALTIALGNLAALSVDNSKLVDGAVTTVKLGAAAVDATKIAVDAVTAAAILAGAVGSAELAAAAVTLGKIAANAVDSAAIAASAVVAGKIGADAVTAAEIAAGAVGTTEIAALAVTAAQIAGGAITTAKIAADAVTAAEIATGAIGPTELAALAVTAAAIAGGAVTTAKIAADAVTAAEIAANAVGSTELAAGSVIAGKIAAGTIVAADIAANTITAAKIAALTITAAEIAAGAITTPKIVAGAVTAVELAAGAVVAGKIAAGTIVAADIAANTITGAKIAALTITATEIAAGAVTTAKITAGAVTAVELAAGAVIAGKILAGTIVAADIAAGTITGAKIAANTIAAGNIAADTITAAEIAANAITATELAAGSVTAAKIVALTITAAELAANTITAAKIAALTITGAEIAAGAITAAKITAGTITATELAAGSVTTAKIAAGAVTATEIATNAITAAKVLAGEITAVKLATDSVETAKIAANAVVAGKIAAGAVTATTIATNAITADKIAAGAVTVGKVLADFPANLLDNPSFESGNLSVVGDVLGWSNIGTGGYIGVPGAAPPHGTRCFTSQGDGVNYVGALSAIIPAKPGATYRVSCWARTGVGTPSFSVQLRSRDASGGSETIRASPMSTVTPPGAWTYYSATWTVPLTGVSQLVVYAFHDPASGAGEYVDLDVVELVEISDQVQNSTNEVTINAAGIAVVNGAITVTNAGSTVVIDGTSNMFKIFATGTMNRSFPSAATQYAETDVTISGSGATPRPCLWHVAVDNGAIGNERYSGYAHIVNASNGDTLARAYCFSNAASTCHVQLACESWVNPGVTATARYYMLVEAGF